MPACDPLHKVTIIPRGRALGVTMNLPERDKYGFSQIEMTSKLAMMFGGRVAEELIFGKDNVTTGAASDIQQATSLARRMVTEFGMSDKLGTVRYNANEQEIFLGHSVAQQQNVSEATAQIIDNEVRRLIEEANADARRILTAHIDDLHKIAQALLVFETLSGDEVNALLRGEPVIRREDNDPPASKPAPSGKRSAIPSTGAASKTPDIGDGFTAPATRTIVV
jgi:cell division protease FtsH